MEIDTEKQVEARYALVQSAKHAFIQGVSKDEWKNHETVKTFANEFKLNEKLLYHIAEFIWTFRKF
jgi:hypothetical protein